MHGKPAILRIVSPFVLVAAAFAQSQPPTPEPTVVTVTAQATPLATTSASVTVLDREYIEDSHAANAADLLRATPFLQIAQNGSAGSLTTISLRGGQSNFTLVMIDSIPVNDITNLLGGAFDFGSLPIDNIERVEIVRGPLSSIYGSDAIGGVINFISRKGSKLPFVELSGEFGSFNHSQMRVDVAGTEKRLQYAAGGTFLDVGNQVEKDRYAVGSAAFDGSLNLGPNRTLDFGVRWLDDHNNGFPTGSGGSEYALSRDPYHDRSKELILGTSLKGQVRPWWQYSLDLDRVNRTEDNTTPSILDKLPPGFGAQPATTSDSDFTRTRFGATSRFALANNLSLAIGASVRRETGDDSGFLYFGAALPQNFSIDRTTFLGNSELQYSTNRFTATAGLSFDKTEHVGEVTSPRLGMNWLLIEGGPRLKSSWGKGFKLPSFYALANPLVGNPKLRPERANSFDVGLEQRYSGLTASVTYFRTSYTDQVDFDPTIFKLVNRSHAVVQGVEIGADYAIGKKMRFGGDISWLTWDVGATGQPLRNVPHANGGIHMEYKATEKLRFLAETQWMGPRDDFETPVPAITTVGGYSNTNLSANYDAGKKVTFYVRADNLFDGKFHEFIGFPNPGINIRVGVQYHVK